MNHTELKDINPTMIRFLKLNIYFRISCQAITLETLESVLFNKPFPKVNIWIED